MIRRQILAWRARGEELIGTWHVPAAASASAPACAVLLLNAGPAPRAGNSDLSVHLGDRLAGRGTPVFRFDFPGLGDSSGALPPDSDAYWREVQAGRNDEVTLALATRIREQFGITHIVVGGLCAA